MPTVDLYLPPRAFTTLAAKDSPKTVHPLGATWKAVVRWIERARQRQVLATLDDHMLRDIGVTRTDAERECRKPFWR